MAALKKKNPSVPFGRRSLPSVPAFAPGWDAFYFCALKRCLAPHDTCESACCWSCGRQSQNVRLILNMIPRPLREVLVLRELQELSYRQISDITGLPIGTVMSRLARARRRFGDSWGYETN